MHFWQSSHNTQVDAAVILIKNLKKLEKFRVNLFRRSIKEFLDENLLIRLLQESTERPTLTVKFCDFDDFDATERWS